MDFERLGKMYRSVADGMEPSFFTRNIVGIYIDGYRENWRDTGETG